MSRILFGLFAIWLLNGEIASGKPLETPPPRRHVVEIRDFGFYPQHTLAVPGDTVVWVNRDLVPHTATANDGGWGSKELEEGESWEMVVRGPGMGKYHCEFHPNMLGVLEERVISNANLSSVRSY